MARLCDDVSLSGAVVSVFVVGFHHTKGRVVEYAYPRSFAEASAKGGKEAALPQSWADLLHLCVPDGAHNCEQDTVYFTVPSPSVVSSGATDAVLYGVACCRQTDTGDLKHVPDEAIRSTVLKSVCALCTLPLYGVVDAKLHLATHAYFNEGDFRKVAVLEELFHSLCTSLKPGRSLRTVDLARVGASPRVLLQTFGYSTLKLFKALLLHSQVLVFGNCARVTCRHVMSLYSLLPSALEMLLDKDANGRTGDAALHFGTFSDPHSLRPFVCLPQSKELRSENSKWLLAGTTSALLAVQQKSYCHVFASAGNGSLSVNQDKLQQALNLTTADLRFTEILLDALKQSSDDTSIYPPAPCDWRGSDEWIRSQFREYTDSLVVTSIRGDSSAQDDFNSSFIKLWLKSRCFLDSADRYITNKTSMLDSVLAQHPCAGSYTWDDVKRKVILGTEDLKLVASDLAAQAKTSSVGASVTKMFNSASGSLWQWWNREPPSSEAQDSGTKSSSSRND